MRLFHTCQKGSILTLMAFTIPFLFALSAIAVDCGGLYVQRSHMQNMADAAALAGAAKLGSSNDDAKALAEEYIQKNSAADDASNTYTYTVSEKNGAKTLRVDVAKAASLLFMKMFNFDSVNLSVYAVASRSSGSKNIFEYTIISGAQKGETIDTSKVQYYWNNPDPRVLNLGPGGTNTFNGKIHSNYLVNQGGGKVTVNGTLTAVDSAIWSSPQSSSFALNGTYKTDNLIDISVNNSGLSDLIEQTKSRNTYSGNFTNAAYFNKFGNGIYVTGAFTPSYIPSDSSLDTTTVVIAEGNINFPSNNGKSMSSNNHIIFISLKGNIDLTFNGPFYGILYAPNGNINLNMGGSTFTGSIIGKTLSLGYGSTTVNYNSYVSSSSRPAKVQLIE